MLKKLLIALICILPAVVKGQTLPKDTIRNTPASTVTPQWSSFPYGGKTLLQATFNGKFYFMPSMQYLNGILYGNNNYFKLKIDSLKSANNIWKGTNTFKNSMNVFTTGTSGGIMVKDTVTNKVAFITPTQMGLPNVTLTEFSSTSQRLTYNGSLDIRNNATDKNINITDEVITRTSDGKKVLWQGDTSVANNYQSKIWKNVKTDGGAKGDSTVNENQYIQPLLNAGGNIYFPAGRYMINGALNVKSNTNLFFHQDAILIQRPTANNKTYSVLRIDSVQNVTVQGGQIVGDKYNHIGTGGEHGNGLSIYSSDNVAVRDMRISKTWGDGVYVGIDTIASNKRSRNVSLENVSVSDFRRNGLSITYAERVRVIGGRYSNGGGTEPQSGIDVEPNTNGRVKDVVIQNVTASNNTKNGILMTRGSTTTDSLDNIQVIGGTFSNNGAEGIRAINPTNARVSNATLSDNGKTTNNTYGAISVETGSDNAQITGNTILAGTLNTNKIKYGIVFLGSNRAYAADNIIQGAVTSPFGDAGTKTDYALNRDTTRNSAINFLGVPLTTYVGDANASTRFSKPGYYVYPFTTGATNFPFTAGVGQLTTRAANQTSTIETVVSSGADSTIYFRKGASPWMRFISQAGSDARYYGIGNPNGYQTASQVQTAGDARYAPLTRIFSPGVGMTGGGSFAADRTFNVDTAGIIASKPYLQNYTYTKAQTNTLLNGYVQSVTAGTGSIVVGGTAQNPTIATVQGITTGSTVQFGFLGVGVSNGGTARIIPAAGTTTAAPFRFFSGVASQTSLQQGSLNFDGTDIYYASGATPTNRVVVNTAAAQSLSNKVLAPSNTYQSKAGGTTDSVAFVNTQQHVSKALVAGPGISVTQAANSVTISAATNVVEITGTTQTATANTIYIPHNASLTTITVPTTTTIGSLYQVIGEGAGGWKLQLPAGYTAVGVGSFTTTSGGSLNSTDKNCTITIRLTNTNKFTVTTSQGTINPL